MNLTAIRQAVADLASTVPGVRGYPYRNDSFVASGGDGLAAAMLIPGEPYVEYLRAMSGGQCEIHLVMQVRVPVVAEEAGQRRLDDLVSAGLGEARSIVDAIKPDDLPQTLGGLIEDLKIDEVRMGAEPGPDGATRYFGADFNIDILARRVHT